MTVVTFRDVSLWYDCLMPELHFRRITPTQQSRLHQYSWLSKYLIWAPELWSHAGKLLTASEMDFIHSFNERMQQPDMVYRWNGTCRLRAVGHSTFISGPVLAQYRVELVDGKAVRSHTLAYSLLEHVHNNSARTLRLQSNDWRGARSRDWLVWQRRRWRGRAGERMCRSLDSCWGSGLTNCCADLITS